MNGIYNRHDKLVKNNLSLTKYIEYVYMNGRVCTENREKNDVSYVPAYTGMQREERRRQQQRQQQPRRCHISIR